MKLIKIIFGSCIIYALIILSVSCVKERKFINIINNTDSVIWCAYSFAYPNIYTSGFYDTREIQPHSNVKIYGHITGSLEYTWEQTFTKYVSSDTLMIFISDSSVILNMPDDTEIHSVIQRYDVSLQDLINLNWTLYYPPTEAMKNIKMFPPYSAE